MYSQAYSASQIICCVFITVASQLMQFKEIITVDYENRMKHEHSLLAECNTFILKHVYVL
jgi:hypothetical protein